MKFLRLSIIHLLIFFIACSCQTHSSSLTTRPEDKSGLVTFQNKPFNSESAERDTHKLPHLEIPFIHTGEEIIYHTGYTLSYNEKHEQANWVAYELTDEKTKSLFKRSNKFMEDPQVSTGSAKDDDYVRSGYDRGHLAPAADMSWSLATMTESFYYSNMSPQDPGFNRGIWKKLEEKVRSWAQEYHSIYITTGPVLSQGLPFIGPDKVSIPHYYYKVILDYTSPTPKGIGFIIPNEKSNTTLEQFVVSIDEVEKITGIDFFYRLPDNEENYIESHVNKNDWDFGPGSNKNYGQIKNINRQDMESTQCKGITKKGNRCLNKTNNPSGYCRLHLNQIGN